MNPLSSTSITSEYFSTMTPLLGEEELKLKDWKNKLNFRILQLTPNLSTIISTFLRLSEQNISEYQKNACDRANTALQFSTKLKKISLFQQQLEEDRKLVKGLQNEYDQLKPDGIITRFNDLKKKIEEIKKDVKKSQSINEDQQKQIRDLNEELKKLKDERRKLQKLIEESKKKLEELKEKSGK